LHFAFAETVFSFLLEYEGDIDTSSGFDFFIAVDKIEVQQPCQLPADC